MEHVESSAQANPLLQDFEFPPYDAIKAHHVVPGIRALLNQLEGDLIELESKVEPSWPKLVHPLEKIIDRLGVIWGIVCHLNSVKDSPELRVAFKEVQPEVIKFDLRLGQSKSIYGAFKAIQESDWQTLSDAQKRVVELKIKEAILNGVSLEDDKKEQFNKIQQELEKLSKKFAENIMDAIAKFEKLITNKKVIEGLPATTLGLAAQKAASKGLENATTENGPWILTLDTPNFLSIMQHAQNRSLREEFYCAHVTLASSEDLDNTEIIDQILRLRLEKAKLLGYNNYAELSMATKMANIDKAEELLENLRIASWNAAIQDLEDVKSFCKNQGAVEANELSQWDINFWSERLRESKYGINEEELRPFFALPNVMNGLFNLVKMLFGVDIESADGVAPVWNSDVKFYRVKDSFGNPISYFYFDPYSRPFEKRGGAWMIEVVHRHRAHDGASTRLPMAHIVCNLTPPIGNKPSLMTFFEVRFIFHEFGHALQHMLTKQDERLVSGTRGIEWDAVELPSQFMENWRYERDTLMSMAKHYETGEILPNNVYLKLLAARTFRAGSLNLQKIRRAKVDLELHSKYVSGGSESIHDVDKRISKRTETIPLLLEDKFLCSFNHIFAGGYAAGYYSYKWAEVLSVDAFSAFEDAGLDDKKAMKELGQKFRETILAIGGGKAPLEVFREFRGRGPSMKALLRHHGLLSVTASTQSLNG